MNKCIYGEWMSNIKSPISPEELLDDGLSPLIKLMNNKNMWTLSSCCHEPCFIFFNVKNENLFLKNILPNILKLNDNDDCGFYTVDKVYKNYNDDYFNDGIREKRDKYGNQYCWMIKNNWVEPEGFIRDLIEIFK